MSENFKRLLAHKLGNLVMLARNPVEMLDEPDLLPEQRELLRNMLNDSLESMAQLVIDLTDLGRIEDIHDEPLGSYSLETAIRHAIQQTRELMNSSVHTIEYREQSPLIQDLFGQSDLIEHAICKLLHNAIKFTPGGGTITVTLSQNAHSAQITVSDPGLGINAEYMPRIFDPFFRVKDQETAHLPGVGLGLWVALSIVRVHGGDIAAESTHGEGSTFTVTLPFEHEFSA